MVICISKKKLNIAIDCFDLALSPQDKKYLFSRKYDLIGFQLHSFESLKDSLALIKEIKENNPITKIIVGGYVASLWWSNLLDKDFINYVVIGEGEISMEELLEKVILKDNTSKLTKIKGIAFRGGDEKIFTGPRKLIKNLNSLPLPDREAFPYKKYPQWGVITSRGCPYACSFCTVPRFWGGKVRFRSPENVYKELCELESKYNVKKFLILDDTFSVNKYRLKKLMSMIINGNHNFEWACFTRADCVDKEILNLFKKAGCTEISYGVESANQKTLDFLNKNIKISQIKKAIKLTKEVGIRVRCSFIFGLPNENENDVIKTIEFILETEPHEVQIYPLVPYPGTPIYENSEEYGIRFLSKNIGDWRKDALNPIVETKFLSKKGIINLVRYCIDLLKERGYIWIPGDKKPGKYFIDRCVMTEFSPIQSLPSNEV